MQKLHSPGMRTKTHFLPTKMVRKKLGAGCTTAPKMNPGPWLRTSLFACYVRNEILVSTVRLSRYVRAINRRTKFG